MSFQKFTEDLTKMVDSLFGGGSQPVPKEKRPIMTTNMAIEEHGSVVTKMATDFHGRPGGKVTSSIGIKPRNNIYTMAIAEHGRSPMPYNSSNYDINMSPFNREHNQSISCQYPFNTRPQTDIALPPNKMVTRMAIQEHGRNIPVTYMAVKEHGRNVPMTSMVVPEYRNKYMKSNFIADVNHLSDDDEVIG